jgi:hypothetical protein
MRRASVDIAHKQGAKIAGFNGLAVLLRQRDGG